MPVRVRRVGHVGKHLHVQTARIEHSCAVDRSDLKPYLRDKSRNKVRPVLTFDVRRNPVGARGTAARGNELVGFQKH